MICCQVLYGQQETATNKYEQNGQMMLDHVRFAIAGKHSGARQFSRSRNLLVSRLMSEDAALAHGDSH